MRNGDWNTTRPNIGGALEELVKLQQKKRQWQQHVFWPDYAKISFNLS